MSVEQQLIGGTQATIQKMAEEKILICRHKQYKYTKKSCSLNEQKKSPRIICFSVCSIIFLLLIKKTKKTKKEHKKNKNESMKLT